MRSRSVVRTGTRPKYINAFWAGSNIILLSRDEGGELVREIAPVEHASFIRKAAFDKHPELRSVIESSRYITGWREEGEFIRIQWTLREKAIAAAEKDGWFAQHGIDVFEADVDPVRRYITDNRIEIARPLRCYLDLETDDRLPFSQLTQMTILCWAVVSEDGTRKMTGVLSEESTEGERTLLKGLFEELRRYDQVCAWNGDRFDFKVIAARLAAVGLAVEMRRWLWTDHLPVFERFNMNSAESGEEKQSMSLGSVAAAVLGPDEKKLVKLGEVGGKRTYAMWKAGGEERDNLVVYCLDDADKERRIEDKTGCLETLFAVAQATHTFPDTRGADPVKFVEGYLLWMGAERGMHFPTWHPPPPSEEREKYRGAWVMEPTRTGILRDVHVADFARLYPSIIITWNMSLETMGEPWSLEKRQPTYLAHLPSGTNEVPVGYCAAPNITVDEILTVYDSVLFRNEPEGILPAMCIEFIRMRSYWDDEKKKHPPGSPLWVDANRRAAAFKICVNSVYGVAGSIWSRFFNKQLAESVTQAGVWLIQKTIEAGETRRIRTIYGDTDSTFSMGVGETEFAEFVKWCNADLYPRILKERGCTRNAISLAYEKAFDFLVMLGKKRYAGKYLHYKGKRADASSKPEIKGLEFKRGDVARLARQMQSDVINLLLAGKHEPQFYEDVVMAYRKRVLEGQLELADVKLAKGLSKSLREYIPKIKKDGEASALPPHVIVAKELAKRGRDVGQGIRIEYYVRDASTDPPIYAAAEDWKGDVDRYHVWENQVYPATLRVLATAFPRHDWVKFERARPKKDGGTASGTLFTKAALAVPVGARDKRVVVAAKKPGGSMGQGSLF